MKHGINKDNLDPSISPKVDFYEYACGGWKKMNPLPAEFASFSTFDKLREDARKIIQELIFNLGKTEEASIQGSIEQKISDIYSLGMDEERLNREKASPLLPTLEKVDKFNMENLTDFLVWLHQGIDSTLFSTGVGPHPDDSNLNIFHIGETGLGLGDRDYYLQDNDESKRIMLAYENYVKKIMTLIGENEQQAQRIWNNVIRLEKKFAQNKMTREQRRDPLLGRNLFSPEELKSEFPNIEWERYFNLLLGKSPEIINVHSVRFLKFINDLIPQLSEQELKDYVRFSVTANSTGLLSDDFSDADFDLYGRVMNGQKEQKPRWKRAMAIPNSMFGEAIGEIYVKKYFPESHKNYMKNLVENLRSSLRMHIDQLDWMSQETKHKAKEKLANMKVKIGYPDKWKDYSDLKVDPSLSYLENVQNASVWFAKDNYAKLSKPVDKEEWHMTPQTVNAYYSPLNNEICFPAAILQPPFFDLEADDALNYGGIGTVIGHEMTHGFDDQGRQFDKMGNLNDWWTEKDSENFKRLNRILVNQFDEIEVAPGVFAKGEFTLGENIADQGGIRVSLSAYLNSDAPKVIIDGFDPVQRFFLAYAGIWANNITEENILSRTKSDPHSLPKNRVNVTLRNIDEFFNAFDISSGYKMFREPEERVIIW